MRSPMTRGDQYADELFVGQAIHSIRYGGTAGYIAEIAGGYTHVRLASGYDTILPEAILRGDQWFLSAEVADAKRIDAAFAAAVETRVAEIHRQAQAYMVERARCLRDYSHLETVADYEARIKLPYGALACGAANLRRELQRAFPGIRFSVRSYLATVIDVAWADGPTTDEVTKISGRYEDCPSAFTDLFGGARSVFINREGM